MYLRSWITEPAVRDPMEKLLVEVYKESIFAGKQVCWQMTIAKKSSTYLHNKNGRTCNVQQEIYAGISVAAYFLYRFIR